MKLPLADLRAAPAALAAVALPLPSAHVAQWKLQLQHAQADLLHGAAAQPVPAREDEGRDLERCGAPLAPADPAPQRPAPLATPAACAEESVLRGEGREHESERAPVRLHVQATPGDGVKVWLGIDGDASLVAQRAGAAVADLRRNLQSSGERIAEIVCNGVPVRAQGPFPAAPVARTHPSSLKESR